MKKKVLILGSSSFAGASMVNFLLKKRIFTNWNLQKEKNKTILTPS